MRENSQDIKEIDSSESKNENTLINQNEKKNKICNIQKDGSKLEKINQNSINYEEQNNTNTLTEEEIIKAKRNSFFLLGKTGVGKTSLLNVIYSKDIGKVGHTTLSEAKNSNYYCLKEKLNEKIIYFCIIDTPGLYDTHGVQVDEIQKKNNITHFK